MAKAKAITKIDDMGMFIDKSDEVLVDSRFVAEVFEKNHRDVLRDIRNILGTDSEKVAEFNLRNFAQMSYADSVGRKYPCFAMTREGFNLLVMGWNGKKTKQSRVSLNAILR